MEEYLMMGGNIGVIILIILILVIPLIVYMITKARNNTKKKRCSSKAMAEIAKKRFEDDSYKVYDIEYQINNKEYKARLRGAWLEKIENSKRIVLYYNPDDIKEICFLEELDYKEQRMKDVSIVVAVVWVSVVIFIVISSGIISFAGKLM